MSRGRGRGGGARCSLLKFVADQMLGKLVRWLRILGYDTRYDRHVMDPELARIARSEQRVLLTRDTRLPEERCIDNCVVIESDNVTDQLRQVSRELDIRIEDAALFTRCAKCNQLLQPMPKEEVQDRVPPYVYQTQEKFVYCDRCDRIYWSGSHVDAMVERLKEL